MSSVERDQTKDEGHDENARPPSAYVVLDTWKQELMRCNSIEEAATFVTRQVNARLDGLQPVPPMLIKPVYVEDTVANDRAESTPEYKAPTHAQVTK